MRGGRRHRRSPATWRAAASATAPWCLRWSGSASTSGPCRPSSCRIIRATGRPRGSSADAGVSPTVLEQLSEAAARAEVAGIVSGYLASPAQADAVAALVRAVKAARPRRALSLRPGDRRRRRALYVGEALAAAIRDALLPLADVATPNAFECAWLAGEATDADQDLAALARGLPPPVVLVTSAPALMRGQIGNLLVTATEAILFEHPLSVDAGEGHRRSARRALVSRAGCKGTTGRRRRRGRSRACSRS